MGNNGHELLLKYEEKELKPSLCSKRFRYEVNQNKWEKSEEL